MNYYLVGIKGSGMAALALILQGLGNKVKGADVDKKLFTEEQLINNGIEIQSLDSMNFYDSDVIIVGNAFSNKYDFIGKEVVTYQDMVSYLCDKYYSIAVCGTHGKTTDKACII